MRILKYDLFPEAYGSNGKFVSKEGTMADLIIDTGMLLNSDFDKVIPRFNTLNKMKKGLILKVILLLSD